MMGVQQAAVLETVKQLAVWLVGQKREEQEKRKPTELECTQIKIVECTQIKILKVQETARDGHLS